MKTFAHKVLWVSFLITSCKFSWKGSSERRPPVSAPTLVDKGPLATLPGASPTEADLSKAPWKDMRQDCGGTKFQRSLDLFSISQSGSLIENNLALIVKENAGEHEASDIGSPEAIAEKHKKICDVFLSYFKLEGEIWSGEKTGSLDKGSLVKFEPSLTFSYQKSLKVDSIAKYRKEEAPPYKFTADSLSGSLSFAGMSRGEGSMLISDVPFESTCDSKLQYQLYTYSIKKPITEAEQKFCRTLTPPVGDKTGECLKADTFLCPSQTQFSGECPLALQRPTLNSCAIVIPKVPVIDYSGKEVGSVKVGAFLKQIPHKTNKMGGYRLTIHRIEVL